VSASAPDPRPRSPDAEDASRSKPKNPSAAALRPEPPELAAERERLLPELEKQAKAATGTTQAVLRKLHEVLVHTKLGVPVDFQLYEDAKLAFERFAKEPVLPPPAVIMQVLEFMQKRAVAMGWTGQMQLPKGAPPPPPGLVGSISGRAPTPAAAASAAPRGSSKDGFEGSAILQGSVALNPASGAPGPASQGKAEPQPESSTPGLKNPGAGHLKG
jgi:hypothetical protein